MSTDGLPWLLVLLLGWALLVRGCANPSAEAARLRAERAEDSIRVLLPAYDSLALRARLRDTVLVEVTDTLEVTLERVRVEVVEASDSLRSVLDSVQTELLNELEAAHAEEVLALERLAEQRLIWGESWRDAALATNALLDQYRVANDAKDEALAALRREDRWIKLGATALLGIVVYDRLR